MSQTMMLLLFMGTFVAVKSSANCENWKKCVRSDRFALHKYHCFYSPTNEKLTWIDAKEKCKSVGGQLAVAPDKVILKKFDQEFSNYFGSTYVYVWAGFVQGYPYEDADKYKSPEAKEGWFWLDDTGHSKLWTPGEPNDGGDAEMCGNLVSTKKGQVTLNDSPCGSKHSYICQIKPSC